ncbi:MAG: SUMF1/EgtB/PvdO family nonheme iron enzyme [Lewinellaceae bacterium]|nr:SUMF1/EgtB/PvdO family nonheme iron enzyme [Lewinellaceae bacterium]
MFRRSRKIFWKGRPTDDLWAIKVNRHKVRNRVNRGGSWGNNATNCRAAYRNNNEPANRNANLGFRLVSVSLQLTGEPDGIH